VQAKLSLFWSKCVRAEHSTPSTAAFDSVFNN
jgi:hypothetical protein